MSTGAPQAFVLASNLDPNVDSGISNTAQAFAQRFAPDARVESLGHGWRIGRVAELLGLRRLLVEQLNAGTPCVIEGYKAALFCFCALGSLRRAPKSQVTFLIFDAGVASHLRIARFWAERFHPLALYRLYRAALDFAIERLVLKSRPVAVVSEAEAAKIDFTDNIIIEPPPGAPTPEYTASAPVSPVGASPAGASLATAEPAPELTENDMLLYADMRVPHLRRSVIDSLRQLHRSGVTLPNRLVLLGRRPAPRTIQRLAPKVFQGGLLDLVYAKDLPTSLRSAGSTWLPDLVGSGVKNRTIDALRYAPKVIASEVALEGVPAELISVSADSTRLRRYQSLEQLPACLR